MSFGMCVPVIMFRQINTVMTGIDSVGFMMMAVTMLAVMVMVSTSSLELETLLTAPGTPQHPKCNDDDQRRRRQLEVRLSGLSIEALAQVHAAHGDQPHHSGVR